MIMDITETSFTITKSETMAFAGGEKNVTVEFVTLKLAMDATIIDTTIPQVSH